MSKYIYVFLILMFISHSTFSNESETLSVDQAISQALINNPNLASINARFLAMSEKPIQAGALPEPTIKLNMANIPVDSFALDQTPMSQIQIGISQPLPFPGKLALKSQAASNMATASNANWKDAKRKLVQQITHQWWHIFYLHHALEILEKNATILERFVGVAETKYSVGQGLQQDILLAQVEVYKLQDKKLQLDAMRSKATAILKQLMGLNNKQDIKLNNKINNKLPVLNYSSDIVNHAIKQRPDMTREQLISDAAENRYQLAKKDFYPDFQVGALYGWRKDESDLASVQLSMNIPWDTGSRQNPAKDQRNQEWMQQKYTVKALENKIVEDIEIAMANYNHAVKQMNLFKNAIIPQAEQMVESMLAAYQVNKVDFLNLSRAQINLFNFETQYWLALSTANQSMAALDAAIGKEYISKVYTAREHITHE